MKVYTKTGDKGETSLVHGERVGKDDLRVISYGNIDEVNSYVGHLRELLKDDKTRKELEKIQNELFNLGGLVSCSSEKRLEYKLPKIEEKNIKFLEERIDEYTKELPELKNFILPGGSVEASVAHICRTVTRRLERSLYEYSRKYPTEIDQLYLSYVNRLSDYFFVLGRYINLKLGKSEVEWKK